MSVPDLLLALLVAAAWGINFVVIKVGLHGVPPMLLGAMRFTLAAFPAVLFVKRPRVPWGAFMAYGAFISVGQFALLFTAMAVGMPAGLASLVLQAQAFFTILLARVILGERLSAARVAGLGLAAAGLVVIGFGQGGPGASLAGFALTIAAAGSWAAGNIVTKAIGKVDMLGLVVWASLIPPLPFLALSLLTEGPARIATALAGFDRTSAFAVGYLAFAATLLGYGLWSRLLSRYPASQVAPFSLLVPAVGLTSAAVLLGERLSALQGVGIGLVMLGLVTNAMGGRQRRALHPKMPVGAAVTSRPTRARP